MRFTVTCHKDAEDQLADIWANHTDRNAIAAASHAIERELAEDAHLKGLDFYGDRLLIVAPLAATFKVSIDDCLVEILHLSHQ